MIAEFSVAEKHMGILIFLCTLFIFNLLCNLQERGRILIEETGLVYFRDSVLMFELVLKLELIFNLTEVK